MIKTLDEQFTADITDLVDRHGCAHFLSNDLQPVEQLKDAIRRLESVDHPGHQEEDCIRDLRKLLNKYEQAEATPAPLGRGTRMNALTLEQFRATGRNVPNVDEALPGEFWGEGPGRIYAGPTVIEQYGDQWRYMIENESIVGELNELESSLYEWAIAQLPEALSEEADVAGREEENGEADRMPGLRQ
ncbi:MAG: hypothetical protein JWL65_5890 [Gammaproteobacteria bacterium]|nr:hypothetical protein [Gammaproteobacteria bacterium]